MANETRDRGRFPTRTWRSKEVAPAGQAAPVVQVQDPAVRAILQIVSRSLKAICAEIDRRTAPTAADDG